MRKVAKRFAIAICAIVAISLAVAAQAPAQETRAQETPAQKPVAEDGSGSISGRVTLHGRPFSNAQVLLVAQPKDSDNPVQSLTQMKPALKTSTDSDGRYSFTNLAAGHYELSVFAPTMVSTGHEDPVIVADGGAVESVDFSLTPGGVITGTVLLSDGRPAIHKPILVDSVNRDQSAQDPAASDKAAIRSRVSSDMKTDDRGVYRVYGLAPGDYLVSVQSGGGKHENTFTYYPGVTDKAKAAHVKVKAGSEATGIDLKLGLSRKGYEVRGRVVDESGKGVPAVMIACIATPEETTSDAATPSFSGFSGEVHSNSKGEFKIEGVRPGKYSASIMAMFDEANFYGDATAFEVINRDLSGVEIKTHKGLTASGVAAIEDNDDPAVAAQLPQVQLMATATAPNVMAGFSMSRANIAPDGRFTFTGLRPGKLMLMINPMVQESPFAITRIERGGAVQSEGIELTPDNSVTDIKLILGYRNCAIYGRVSVSGGTVPNGTALTIWVRHQGSDMPEHDVSIAGRSMLGGGVARQLTVSPGGEFRIDGLVPGEYQVILTLAGKLGSESKSSTQTVTLSSGAELRVDLTLDLTPDK